MNYNCKDIIDLINKHKINLINFCVVGYSHYKNCYIKIRKEILPSLKSIFIITFNLTDDCYEDVSFLDKVDEKYKIFNMGKKGKFTLEQLWNNIKIISLI